MASLAATYWNQGRWKDAEKLEVYVMEASQRVLGEEHPDTVTAISNLAATYWNLGQWKDAEDLDYKLQARKSYDISEPGRMDEC
jgi:Tetratricopeptide repeat